MFPVEQIQIFRGENASSLNYEVNHWFKNNRQSIVRVISRQVNTEVQGGDFKSACIIITYHYIGMV